MNWVKTAALAAAMTSFALAGAMAADGIKPAAKEFRSVGGDLGNSRYSVLDQINTGNVAKLGGAWMVKFEGEMSRATPVVADGVMYLTMGKHVYALDPVTGKQLWAYQPESPPSNLAKGVAVGEGKVFVGLSDSSVVALDAKTGQESWNGLVGEEKPEEVERPVDKMVKYTGQPPAGQYISAAPTYANGVVVFVMANGDYGLRGRVVGFDAKTGKKLWQFNTVPGPGEFGHETWGTVSDAWKTGGAGVWTTPAIDPDLNLVYFGTGNAMPSFGGEVRPGDNLFTTSAVALDLKTGKRKWHFQLTHHDIWEDDVGTPLVLFDTKDAQGKPRKAIAIMRADSQLFMLDRATGKPIFQIEERPVKQNARLKTSPTQPYPVGGEPLGPRCVQAEVVPLPGFELGCKYDPLDVDTPNLLGPGSVTRFAPIAFDPVQQRFFAGGSITAQWLRRWQDGYFLQLGVIPGVKPYGVRGAFDVASQKYVWRERMDLPQGTTSGFLATKGGLLFHGDQDGHIQAYSSADGKLLWQFQTGAPEDGPVSTYEINGEQYVAVAATGNVWAFKLGGTVPPQPAPAMPAGNVFKGRIVNTDEVELGRVVMDTGLFKRREELDEWAVYPNRVKVKAGTKVTFTNGGKRPHSANAMDGSWSTGPIQPGQSATVTFDKPGTYIYNSKENPWSYGELTVE
jgi:glucose dehydrogenase